MPAFRKILVAHDFSEHAEHALESAVDLARRSEGSLTLVHVLQPIMYTAPDGILAVPLFDQSEIIAKCEKHLDEAKARVLSLGVREVDAKMLRGVPVVEIVTLAKRGGHDLIVMGTHGRTGVSHAFMGSVAERVVRTASCPVLVVPKAPAQAA